MKSKMSFWLTYFRSQSKPLAEAVSHMSMADSDGNCLYCFPCGMVVGQEKSPGLSLHAEGQ